MKPPLCAEVLPLCTHANTSMMVLCPMAPSQSKSLLPYMKIFFPHKPQEFPSAHSTSPSPSHPQVSVDLKLKDHKGKPPVQFLLWTWMRICPKAINQRTGLASLMREGKGEQTGKKSTSVSTLKSTEPLVVTPGGGRQRARLLV